MLFGTSNIYEEYVFFSAEIKDIELILSKTTMVRQSVFHVKKKPLHLLHLASQSVMPIKT